MYAFCDVKQSGTTVQIVVGRSTQAWVQHGLTAFWAEFLARQAGFSLPLRYSDNVMVQKLLR